MVPHTRSQGPPPPVVPLPPATRPRRQSAASPTTPTDDYVTSADEDEGPNASGERPATTPLTNNDQARLSAGLAALVRQREEDVRRQMETIADLREQVQVLARRNQLLMDDQVVLRADSRIFGKNRPSRSAPCAHCLLTYFFFLYGFGFQLHCIKQTFVTAFYLHAVVHYITPILQPFHLQTLLYTN